MVVFLLFLFSSLSGFANEDGVCRDVFEQHGKNSYSRQFFSPDACFVSVKTTETPSLIYRSFIFRETGKLLIFNSYGPGPSETKTGARVFYFFPRQKIPSFSISASTVTVASGTALALVFDAVSGQLIKGVSAVVNEDPKISADNQGGLEIHSYSGLMLDAGFQLGSDPSANEQGSSIFRDVKGQSCLVKNSEVFNIDTDGESTFKFTDQRLAKFLAQRCPGLKFRK